MTPDAQFEQWWDALWGATHIDDEEKELAHTAWKAGYDAGRIDGIEHILSNVANNLAKEKHHG